MLFCHIHLFPTAHAPSWKSKEQKAMWKTNHSSSPELHLKWEDWKCLILRTVAIRYNYKILKLRGGKKVALTSFTSFLSPHWSRDQTLQLLQLLLCRRWLRFDYFAKQTCILWGRSYHLLGQRDEGIVKHNRRIRKGLAVANSSQPSSWRKGLWHIFMEPIKW